MVPLLPLRDGVRALPILSFRQSMPSFYMNAPDCICSPGRLPLGVFCAGRDDLEREALHDDRISIRAPRAGCDCQIAGGHGDSPCVSIHAPHGRGGVSAGRPAGRRFLRPGPSCAYRARFDCRSGTIRRGRTGCRCSWTYPTHPIEWDRTHRTAGHTWRSR